MDKMIATGLVDAIGRTISLSSASSSDSPTPASISGKSYGFVVSG